jgi:pyruvate/2-oxoglutarate dehydrogenase complex dihydrolipoamide dehydrogenase (E3) component
MAKVKKYDLIVIGSGAGGGVGANYARSLGKRVAIFEKGEMGGECPNYGCVPTKAILKSAEVYSASKNSAFLGIRSNTTFSWRDVMAWKNTAVENTGCRQGEDAFRADGIDVYRAEARFVSPKQIIADGGLFTATKFLVATGSRTFIPPIAGIESSGYITSTEALELSRVPRSITIIGGGAIGCEFAEIFATFGSEVSIIESLPSLLAREDDEVGELVAAMFEQKGIKIATNIKVVEINSDKKYKTITVEKNGRKHNIKSEQVLIATGKVGNVELGLDKAKVKFDRRGVKVNSLLRTSNPRIYAAGDVVGPYLFTHTGEYQSQIAVHNAFHRRNRHRVDYSAVPRVTYINPEVAAVGTNEKELKQLKIPYRIGEVPLSIIGRANTSGDDTGFAKIITDTGGRVIGGAVVGPRAGEIIHELGLAIHVGASARDIASTIHAYPTFSEVLMYAARAIKN